MGDRVGVELLYNWVELGPRAVASIIPDSQRSDVVGKATTDREGPSESPDGLDRKIRRTRKTQRDGHNSGIKIWSSCSVSSTLSHANLQQLFRTIAIKRGVNIFVKKSSCVFLLASSLLRLYRCIVVMLHERVNDYITKPGLGVIPSGQENHSGAEYLNFPGGELNVIFYRAIFL